MIPLRFQLARIRYVAAAKRHGWRETWEELSEESQAWWVHPMKGEN